MRSSIVLILLVLFFSFTATAQFSVVRPSPAAWNADWISAQNDDGMQYGVFYFRKNFQLDTKPASFVVYVSADNRYKLYVNGKLISLGPVRGDLNYYNYQTIDLAPYLLTGKNLIAATVWNEAQHRPEAIVSFRTGFILQGKTSAEQIINTNATWKSQKDKGYQPLPGFFAASTGELVNMKQSSEETMLPKFNDADWLTSSGVLRGQLKGLSDGFGWSMVSSPLPELEMIYQRIPVLRKTSGITAPAKFPLEKTAVTIPANTTASFLLDQTFLTNAYLTLNFSKGLDAGISLKYAESMYVGFDQYGGKKGNRNDVDGKIFSGRKDSVISNGHAAQTYTTLNFRTFRYIELIVHTKDEPITIDDIYGTFTGYPFDKTSAFTTSNEEIKNILDIGWRTARLNAFETYTDCPYYEQLQYIGDTRVQAMITYYNSPDDRLPLYALNLIDHSRFTDGLTQSRYPTRNTQLISTFSLWYIGMLYDHWMYRGNDNFIKEKLNGVHGILDFFAKYQMADGSIKNTPNWTFVDWANGKEWYAGNPPVGTDGSSCILDLQLLWAYQWAAKLEEKLGMTDYVNLYAKKAKQLKETILKKYWMPERKLFADTKEKNNFSQHANSLAILTGLVNNSDIAAMAKHMLGDKDLTQCTIYFKYYLHQALTKAGLGNDYMKWLDIWRENIKWGLTTWTEDSNVEYTRSDCHAWGSSPNIEFYRIILGIDTDAPGFQKVKIEPHLGDVTNVKGEIPHPAGQLSVQYKLENSKWNIHISLPGKISGTLVWKGKNYALKAGSNSFAL